MGNESYLIKDLVGFVVVTKEGEKLGQLEEVWATGGNDVFAVRDGEKEVLVPALKDVVLEINMLERRIVVDLPGGLR